MAKTSKKSSETKVTRIIALESASTPRKSVAAAVRKLIDRLSKPKKTTPTPKIYSDETDTRRSPLKRFVDYFRGAWYELQQVRWPDRRTTWAMTGALLLFTAAFIILIILIDFGFNELFKLIMGK